MDRDLRCEDKFGEYEFEAAIQMSNVKAQSSNESLIPNEQKMKV
jgi:hypothetical protein